MCHVTNSTEAKHKICKVREELFVFCRLNFIAYHSWPSAPAWCDFLKEKHRHVFHVECGFIIEHDDREIEFITKKAEILKFVRDNYEGQYLVGMSCEMIARQILCEFDCAWVEVSEDGENGALVNKYKEEIFVK